MTIVQIIEVGAAAFLIGAGVWLQVRSRKLDARRGSQGAVILLAVGAILAVHGLGLLEYRPMGSER